MAGDSQFIRKWSLFVFGMSSGQGVAIAEGTDEPGNETLHVRFEINQSTGGGLPNHGVIKVWNPPPDTIAKIKEYTRVVLQAGYRDGIYGKIFDGWITFFKYGHESAVDSYLELHVSDGDLGVSFGTINKTLMPGANDSAGVLKAISDSMAPLGVKPPDKLPDDHTSIGPIQPRPTVLYGMSRHEMDAITKTNSWLWTVEDGKIHVSKNDIASADQGVVLNAQTGLIGWPTVVSDGVEAKCLLNASIHIKSRVKIDNASINQTVGTGVGTAGNPLLTVGPGPADLRRIAPTSADGTYVAYVVEHLGDTRGNEWFTSLVLWALDSKTGETLNQDGQVPSTVSISNEVAAAAAAAVGSGNAT